MTSERWARALPLILTSSLLLVAAAWAFFQGKDNTASVAAFTAGLIMLGSWLTTAIVDWWSGRPQRMADVEDGGDGETG
jgi:thiol:disulfide interchange protein